jgi:hypothetical protein
MVIAFYQLSARWFRAITMRDLRLPAPGGERQGCAKSLDAWIPDWLVGGTAGFTRDRNFIQVTCLRPRACDELVRSCCQPLVEVMKSPA